MLIFNEFLMFDNSSSVSDALCVAFRYLYLA